VHEEMPISSVILNVAPGQEGCVADRLAGATGVEITRRGESVIIVTTDTPTMDADREVTEMLRDLPGVVSATVAFTSMEDCLEQQGAEGHGPIKT
jgi:nitrate reductase NapAB chaperone NapD